MKFFLRNRGFSFRRHICLLQRDDYNHRETLQDPFEKHWLHISRKRHQLLVNFSRSNLLCRQRPQATMDWIRTYHDCWFLLANCTATLSLRTWRTSVIADERIWCFRERRRDTWNTWEGTAKNLVSNKQHWWNRRMWSGRRRSHAPDIAFLRSAGSWCGANSLLHSRVGLHRR